MIFTSREIAQLRHLEILAAKVSKGQLHGEREMKHPGPGSGFREHRAYHMGDEFRRVDWNVYARMESLVVKEFDAEEALDLVVVQDCSASMRGAAAQCAAKVGAALGVVALSHLDRVRWIAAGGRRGTETFVGRGRQADLLDMVEAEAAGRTDLLAAVRTGQPRTSRGGVAFVVSDFFDPQGATRALSYLLSRRYRVRAIEIEDSEALAPPPLGRTRLVDSETGAVMKLDITPEVLEAYRQARETRTAGLASFCRWAGVGFLRVRADQPFFEIVRTAIARGWLAP
ncbi:MAG: DUF58 domain-containing protein [Planctomycetota bacterium]|jgi:uncharacterized protein (DUF58 family)